MPPRLQLTALLLSAPLATAYLTGEDVTLCWVSRNGTRELLSTCGADFVEFVTTLPTTLDATRQYDVTYRAHVASAALIPTDGFDFPHVNLHVCPRRITFCTPFIADTPELADSRSSQVARAAELKAMLEEAPAPAPPQRELGELEA